MRKSILFLATMLVMMTQANATVVLPSVISDNMVIQRNTSAALWGQAEKGAKVVITASWTKEKTVVTADGLTGDFLARVKTPDAGGPYTITFNDGTGKVSVKNVLSGDVWFCSGQSNMEMPVRGYPRQPSLGGTEAILKAKATRAIRICQMSRKSSKTPLRESKNKWAENTPDVVAATSATAYFFADALQDIIDIPVGIIVSSWGGSSIETWIKRDVIEKEFPELSTAHLDSPDEIKQKHHQLPCLLYNGQVNPLVPYTFKGMIWYQGCTNRARAEQYTRLQPSYVKMMREIFCVPDAPFYFVQITPYKYNNPNLFTSGYFIEAQAKTLQTIPNSAMAATGDIGEMDTIHPRYKNIVGKRLAWLALQHTYGYDAINADAPSYKSVEFKNGRAIVTFNSDKCALAPMSTNLPGFEIAGEDRVFHKAKASNCISGYNHFQVVVSSPDVPNPVAVRYNFRNWSEAGVFNNYGIPAIPFRTDDWDDLQQ